MKTVRFYKKIREFIKYLGSWYRNNGLSILFIQSQLLLRSLIETHKLHGSLPLLIDTSKTLYPILKVGFFSLDPQSSYTLISPHP